VQAFVQTLVETSVGTIVQAIIESFVKLFIPSPGDVLRELECARTLESKVLVWSQSLDPIDSIGQPLSITVGRNAPGEGIEMFIEPFVETIIERVVVTS